MRRAWVWPPSWHWFGWRTLSPVTFGWDEHGRRVVTFGWTVTGRLLVALR